MSLIVTWGGFDGKQIWRKEDGANEKLVEAMSILRCCVEDAQGHPQVQRFARRVHGTQKKDRPHSYNLSQQKDAV